MADKITSEQTKDGETKKASEETKSSERNKSVAESVQDRSFPQSYPPSSASASPSPPPNQSVMPTNINNRPPSATPSIHSNNSGGATRTTATSRRGGRTRSRSPPMVNRASPTQDRAFPPHPSEAPHSPSNPSSAAAAAAAAAKALSGNPGPPYRDDRYRDPRYDGHYRNSRSWPHEDPERQRRSGSYGHSQSIHRLPGGSGGRGGDMHGRHGSYDPYRRRHAYEEYDRRQGRGRTPPPVHRYGQPYYRGSGVSSGDPAPVEARASVDGRPPSRNGGGMSRVIGTATPIHVPRAPEAPPARHSRSGTPASVFRGRPSNEAAHKDDNDDPLPVDEDNPQKILLSLRTPSTSFDEKQPAKQKKDDANELPPSPDEPPQIQHAHRKNNSDIFDPTRSPNKDSIEMAPSFNLFNQSFDSLGDTFNVVGNLDGTLQSTSFGAGPTASGELGQLLAGTGSAGLTFGMSPVNSFGNGPPGISSRRSSGDMMVLGGNDRSASPTQVLGMYHSYSGGGPLDDSHLRMSGGSFGAPSLSHNYTRSFGAEQSPIMSYPSRMGMSYEAPEGGQMFYVFLKRHKAAFNECTFLLPGLKAALLEAPLSKSGDLADDAMKSSMNHGGYPEPSPQDTAIARRRVASAVCAFGGSLSGDRVPRSQSSDKASIFREKDDGPKTVTPSSSSGTPPGSSHAQAKAKYDEMLSSRYYENENRLSWEFEENPPVETPSAEERAKERAREKSEAEGEDEGEGEGRKSDQKPSESETKKSDDEDDGDDTKDQKPNADEKQSPPTPGTPSKSNNSEKRSSENSPGSIDQPKMRYRCKLCGQPKQNHTCTFMQSLARSIGVNVYPAVNAFTAAEPGVVAPPLSEMNNFVASDDVSVADSKASGHPTPDRRMNGSTQVTPESRRSAKSRQMTSPSSTMSTGSATPQRPRTPGSAGRNRAGSSAHNTPASSARSRKRRHGQMHGGPPEDQGDLLFVEPMELKPEQFRTLSVSKNESPDAYTYPALPLPYAQRKRLSDNLFSLSQKIPQLTKECSSVLREAREKDMWDLAVAELMTQVIVVIHCHDGDSRFEGLRQYLLTLGIAS